MNEPYLGMPCLFRPRTPYGRQPQLFAFVTRLLDAKEGIVDILAFPTNSEPLHCNNVRPQSETISVHCWERALEQNIDLASLRAAVNEMQDMLLELDEVKERLAALETRLSNTGKQGASQKPPAPQA
jgi:ABC-type transport system involved in cytochrome bd biosynthesis fused ATPase/permease subunit